MSLKTFDQIYALATAPLHTAYGETFTHPRLAWGVGVTTGVAVAMQEMQVEIDVLKAKLAAAELRECQQLALYSKAEATIGAALIDIKNHDNVECWLHGFIENTTTPWHLYDDAEVFHSRYAMDWPLSVAQHQENVKKLDAVFELDIARLEKQGGAA